jgi:hypothetical protein
MAVHIIVSFATVFDVGVFCGQIICICFPQLINFDSGHLLEQSAFSTLSALIRKGFQYLEVIHVWFCMYSVMLLLGLSNLNVNRKRQICQ